MHQNISLGPNRVNQVCLFRKIKMRLCGTNFCTSSACFALSYVMQPNGPKCIQIVQNTHKHEFRVQWGGSFAFVAKSSDATSWHKLFTTSAHFEPSFLRHPNGTKCTQIVWNAPKHELGSNGVDRVFRCEKFQHDFMAQTFAPVRPVLQ